MLELMQPEDRPKGRAGMIAAEGHERMVRKLERQEQATLVSWLNLNDLPYYHPNPVKRSRIQVGAPDFAVFFRGQVIFLEFKVEGGRFSEAQETFIAKLIICGCLVFIPYNAAEAIEMLKQWKNSLLEEP